MFYSVVKRVLFCAVFSTGPLRSMPFPEELKDVGKISYTTVAVQTIEDPTQEIHCIKSQLMRGLETWVDKNKANSTLESLQLAEFFVYFSLLYRASLFTGSQELDNNLLHHDFMQLIEPIGPQLTVAIQQWPANLDLKRAATEVFEHVGETSAIFRFIEKDFSQIHESFWKLNDYREKHAVLERRFKQNPPLLYASYLSDCLSSTRLFCHQHNDYFFVSMIAEKSRKQKFVLYLSLGTDILPLENGILSEKNCNLYAPL